MNIIQIIHHLIHHIINNMLYYITKWFLSCHFICFIFFIHYIIRITKSSWSNMKMHVTNIGWIMYNQYVWFNVCNVQFFVIQYRNDVIWIACTHYSIISQIYHNFFNMNTFCVTNTIFPFVSLWISINCEFHPVCIVISKFHISHTSNNIQW